MIPTGRSSSRTALRCIHCAFRTKQLALQSRRWRSEHSVIRKYDTKSHDRDRRHSRPEKPGAHNNDTKNFRRPLRLLPESDFRGMVTFQLKATKEELENAPVIDQVAKDTVEEGGQPKTFEQSWQDFTKLLWREESSIPNPLRRNIEERSDNNSHLTMAVLREASRFGGPEAVKDRIKYGFYSHVLNARFTRSDIKNQKLFADLRYPTEWYPNTRQMQRTFHLHVGPTNSGKTYQALQRLEQAANGVYAGPLRLLAHEVFARMNAKGVACGLITGEERRVSPLHLEGQDWKLNACTVEMMPTNTSMEVAVIDEIQMIGSLDRGWAWTQAVLGVKAREVHLCGEERAVPLIQEICAATGEKLEIHRYKRLSPLRLASSSLHGSLDKLRKGDCIVSFSVMGIHALRQTIENKTGRRVATVYGSLPPETRAQQAKLFNDPDNDYDYLVASDAVGMGLNLAIKRIIFETVAKSDGKGNWRTLGIADIKQIAGRAGRYRVAPSIESETPLKQADQAPSNSQPPEPKEDGQKGDESIGTVTTLEEVDFPILAAAMESDPEPLRTAGVMPPASVLERFSSYFPPGTPFSYVLTKLHELCMMHKRYHLCELKDHTWIADLLEPIQNLTIADRAVLCASPVSRGDAELWKGLLPDYARAIADQSGGGILEVKSLPLEVLDEPVSSNREYLRKLERLHKGIVEYLWLSYRFAGIFTTRPLASHVKGLVEEKIEAALGKMSFQEGRRRQIAAKRKAGLEAELAAAVASMEGKDGADDNVPASSGEDARPKLDGEQRALDDTAASYLATQTSQASAGDRFDSEEDIDFEEPGEAELRLTSDEPQQVSDQAATAVVEDSNDAERPVESDDAPNLSSFAQWRSSQRRGESQASHEDEPDTTLVEAASEPPSEPGRAESQSSHENISDTSRAGSAGKSETVADQTSNQDDPDGNGENKQALPNVPPKHLPLLDVSSGEVGRDAISRP